MKLTLIIIKEEKPSMEFDMSESKTTKLDKPRKLGNKTITHAKIGVKMKEVPASGMYAGFIAEIPGVNSQGETIEEVKENIQEALRLILEENKKETMETLFVTNDPYQSFELII